MEQYEAPFRRPLIAPHKSSLPDLLYYVSFAPPLPSPLMKPWQFLKHPYTCYVLGIFFGLSSGVCIGAIDIVYGYWTQNTTHHVDNLQPAMHYNDMLAWVSVIIGAYSFISNWLFLVLLSHGSHQLATGLRNHYFAAALVQDPTYYDEHGPGSIATHANRDITLLRASFGEKLGYLLNAIGTIITCLIMALSRAPVHAGVLLSMFVFSCLVLTVLGILSDRVTSTVLAVDSRLSTFIEQVIASVRVVHSFELTQTLIERMRSLYIKPLARVVTIRSLVRGGDLSAMYFVVTALYALGFWWGSILINEGRERMDSVISSFFNYLNMLFSLTMVISHFQSILESLTTLHKMRLTIERHPRIDVRSTEGRILGMPRTKELPINMPTYTPSFALEHVTFAYPSRPYVASLKDVSIDFKPGTVTALVGPSGSGKSTITSLLSREYDPDSVQDLPEDRVKALLEASEKTDIAPGQGRVLFGGVNVRELNVRWMRSQISVVRQNPQMFSGTIAENVAMGLSAGLAMSFSMEDPEVREKVIAALKKAEAWDFVSKLPEGMDTYISGGRNVHLSGGQRQRIAIARALVREPQVLCLDEATSALDSSTEEKIKENLKVEQELRGMTTIIVAHRLSTIQHADQIVVMKNGQVVERGTHSQLLELRHGTYHKMVMHNRAASGLTADEEEDDDAPMDLASSWRPKHVKRMNYTEEAESPMLSYVQNANHIQHDVASRGGSDLMSASWDASERRNEPSQLYALEQEEKARAMPDIEVGPPESKKTIHFVSLLRKQWWLIVIGSLLATCLAVSFPIVAWLSGYAIESLGFSDLQRMRHDTDKWSLWFFIISIINIFLGFGASFFLETASERLSDHIKVRSLQALMSQEVAFFDQKEHSSGALGAAIFNHASNIGASMGVVLCQLIISLGNLLSSFIMAMVMGWLLAIVTLPALISLLVAGYINVRLMEKYESVVQEPIDRTSTYIAEVIDAIGTVNSLGREADVLDHFEKESENVKPFGATLAIAAAAFSYAQFALYGLAALLMYWGVTLLKEGHVEAFNVFAVFEGIFVAVFASVRLTTFTPDIARARYSFHVVRRWLSRTPRVAAIDSVAVWPPSGPRDIVFRDVELRYPQRPNHAAIQNLNLVIPENSTVAFCGTSGSGKSSTLSLLQRFYDPARGTITYGGMDLRSIPMHQWRAEMAFVSQDPVLYEGTLRWNLLLGATEPENVTDADIEEACRKACVWDFAMALPEGLDTMIGLKGSMLSGGQRQRVCIARALLRRPKILLLDEATSALDPESEVLVQRALDNASANCTTVTIAHRLSTIRSADMICVVEDGQIVEQGTHETLLQKRGRYFELVEAQL